MSAADTAPLQAPLQLLCGIGVAGAVGYLAVTVRRRTHAAQATGRPVALSRLAVPALAMTALLTLAAAWPGLAGTAAGQGERSFGWLLTWWLGLPVLAVGTVTFLGRTEPGVLRLVNTLSASYPQLEHQQRPPRRRAPTDPEAGHTTGP